MKTKTAARHRKYSVRLKKSADQRAAQFRARDRADRAASATQISRLGVADATCESDKICFRSMSKAAKAARLASITLYVYECPRCEWFHLTKLRQNAPKAA